MSRDQLRSLSPDLPTAEGPAPRRTVRFRLMTLLVIVAAVCVLLEVSLAIRNRDGYRTRAVLKLSRNPLNASRFGPGISPADFDAFKLAYTKQLASQELLQRVLARPDIAELATIRGEKEPLRWLQENLQTSYPGDAEILVIELHGQQRTEIAKIANAVVEELLAHPPTVAGFENPGVQPRLFELEKAFVPPARVGLPQ